MTNSLSATSRIPGVYFLGLLSVAFLYYFPSAIDAFMGLPRALIGEARRQGMGIGYEIAALLILSSLVAIGFIRSLPSGLKIARDGATLLSTAGFALFILGGIFIPNKLFVVFLAFISITIFAPRWTIPQRTITAVAHILVAAITLSLALSIYEIVTDTAWAGYTSSSGTKIRRPSAFFYNPNVFGFWLALAGTFFAALYFNQEKRRVAATGIVLCSLGALLASSRGYCYLLIISVIALAALHHKRKGIALKCVLLVSLPLVIGSLTLISLNSLAPSPRLETFAGLAWRLLTTPYEAVTHVLGLIVPSTPLDTELVTKEFRRSFAGRFQGRALDSGIRGMFVGLSGASLAGLLLFYFSCFLRVRKFGNPRVVLFCMMTVFFVVSGLFMSYAVLPLWLSWAVVVAMFQYVEVDEQVVSQ